MVLFTNAWCIPLLVFIALRSYYLLLSSELARVNLDVNINTDTQMPDNDNSVVDGAPA
jgi:hypothetical protein